MRTQKTTSASVPSSAGGTDEMAGMPGAAAPLKEATGDTDCGWSMPAAATMADAACAPGMRGMTDADREAGDAMPGGGMGSASDASGDTRMPGGGMGGGAPSKREKMSGPENPRGKVAGSPQEVGSWIARAGCTHAYAANGVPLSI